MAGKKGMRRPSLANTSRRKVWQSMRIMRQFTIADLCRTAGAKSNNVRKFVYGLEKHGYTAKFGGYVSGRAGSYQPWRIVKDTGPEHPVKCNICGKALSEPCVKEDET